MPGAFGALPLRPDALPDANPSLFRAGDRLSGVLDCTPLRQDDWKTFPSPRPIDIELLMSSVNYHPQWEGELRACHLKTDLLSVWSRLSPSSRRPLAPCIAREPVPAKSCD